ncbi:hypothetical protein JCM10908_006556 [Rhodotorula pacifica]|uniref:uncharacterized protein n=1 Tax=Rhodotorula pacifica TaxID=1495444 RepID=UPI0031717307
MTDVEGPPPTKASLVRWRNAFARVWPGHARTNKQAGSGASSSLAASAGPSTFSSAQRNAPLYSPSGRGLEPGQDGRGRVFGVRLEESLQYASVAISMIAPDGKQYVYGYVPIVVAKCGMMLKETATQTEGIFRVSGSNKRINQLQSVFDQPPRYGKDFDWTGYSVHDAASVLRRYLNSLPDPVIPANLYLDFTAVLQEPQPIAASIAAYRHLISLLPPASRYLLLYLLDFLSVFARCSDKNLMTASNLAVVFQPGLVSPRTSGNNALLGFPGFVEGRLPPGGSSAAVSAAARQGGAQEQAGEHGRGKEVLEFLIEQQAHFMLGLEPPVDEERQKRKGVEISPLSPAAQAELDRQERERIQRDLLMGAGATGLAGAGAGGLQRRGSEKSVERRKLRKNVDAAKEGGAKVKRSKTWGSTARRKRAEGREDSPSPSVTPMSSSPAVPAQAEFPDSTGPENSAPRTSAQPTAVSLAAPASSSSSGSPQLGYRPSVKKARRSTGSMNEPSASSAPASAQAQSQSQAPPQRPTASSMSSGRLAPSDTSRPTSSSSAAPFPAQSQAQAQTQQQQRRPSPGPTYSQAVLAAKQAHSSASASQQSQDNPSTSSSSPQRTLGLGLGFGKSRRKSQEPVVAPSKR